MTLNGVGSYVETADEFIAHWTDVNADRVANSLPELTLQGSFALASFQADRDAVETSISGTEGLENARELASANRDSHKEALRERMGQFRAGVDLHLKNSAYAHATPTIPRAGLAESKFLRPFDDMEDLWGRINGDAGVPGFTPPLLLRAGYALAGYSADLAEMRARFKAVTEAENDQTIGRRQRDALLPPLRERMNQYRSAIELEYGAGNPFYESLPDLYAAPGSTPDKVSLSGQWSVGPPEQATFEWGESSNSNLANYQLRVTRAPTYDTQNAEVVETYAPGTLLGMALIGLENPGDVASYKLYVVLTTGNEAGSDTVTITRPA